MPVQKLKYISITAEIQQEERQKITFNLFTPHYGLASLIQELNVYLNGQTISKTSQYGYIHNWIKDWRQNFDVEIDNGLNTVDDPSKLYSYQNGRNMEGRVVPRLEFLASVYPNADGDKDINTLLKN